MNSQPVPLCPEVSHFFFILLNLPFVKKHSCSSFQAFGFPDSNARLSLISLTTVLAWTKAWTGWRIQLKVFVTLSRVTCSLTKSWKFDSQSYMTPDSGGCPKLHTNWSSFVLPTCNALLVLDETKHLSLRQEGGEISEMFPYKTCPFSAIMFLLLRIISLKSDSAFPVNLFWPTMRKFPKPSYKILN